MKINKVDKDDMKIPPKWLIKEYLALDLPMKFRNKDITNNFNSKNAANQFLNKAAKFNLVVRLKKGVYFAPDPDITIKTWAMEDHHSRLILLDSAFKDLKLDYAFYSMSADHHTDYMPEKVIPVLKGSCKDIDQNHIDHFVYDFSKSKELRLDMYDTSFSVPILSEEDTAVLLLSTYQQREIDAGKRLIDEIDLNKDLRGILGGLGYDEYSSGKYTKVEITRPRSIQEWINEIGLERMKERAGR